MTDIEAFVWFETLTRHHLGPGKRYAFALVVPIDDHGRYGIVLVHTDTTCPDLWLTTKEDVLAHA